jgi:hypothetical protein
VVVGIVVYHVGYNSKSFVQIKSNVSKNKYCFISRSTFQLISSTSMNLIPQGHQMCWHAEKNAMRKLNMRSIWCQLWSKWQLNNKNFVTLLNFRLTNLFCKIPICSITWTGYVLQIYIFNYLSKALSDFY